MTIDVSGLRQGEYLKYYYNGELATKGFYKDDNLNGGYLQYYSSGVLALKCFYKHSKLEGEYLQYSTDGILESRCFYSKGKEVSEEEYKIILIYHNLKRLKKII